MQLLVVIGLVGLIATVHAEVFTSLVDLEHVIYTENSMLDALREYIKNEELKLDRIKE